ncbi:hypothetical protein FAUST_4504 [Fusarium austroamericanum]|uniref:BTB domain-containing protein n=1 Tax=Fusarium austroamericanum TaxID=282268 RepID=A0AAN6C2R3_FUSAU|nr:hypothetical protein FAUST_4504 [Fusarium austroamericanum]
MSARYPSRGGESSRYQDDVYLAYFKDGEPSWVHSKVLESYPHLAKRVSGDPDDQWPFHVNFKEFDHNVGYAIIHFLYTGTYRSYKAAVGQDSTQKYQCELAEGLQVYIAGSSLELLRLKVHAEIEIKCMCENMSLQNIFEVIDDLRIGLDQVPTLEDYLQDRMAEAKFGAPGDTTQDVVRDLESANTISTLALKTLALQHQCKMDEDKKKKSAQEALQTGANSALRLMECELEFLLTKKAKKGGRLFKSERMRLNSLEADILRIRDRVKGKHLSGNVEDPDISTKGDASIEVASQNRGEKAKPLKEKPAGTPGNKQKLNTRGLQFDHTGATWLGRKANLNHVHVDDLESFEDDISTLSDSIPWMTPTTNDSSCDACLSSIAMTSDNKSPTNNASADIDSFRIYFQGQGPYLVTRTALNKCPILAARIAAKPFFSISRDTIDVKEIPYDVGAAVIYFLDTGKYRILDPKLDSHDERLCSDLGTAFRVYAAATMLELIGLKNAVNNAMANLEDMMDLGMVARSLKETGLNLEEYPTLAMHLYSYIQISEDISSKEEMTSMIAKLGFPASVDIDSFQSCLVSKGSPVEEGNAKVDAASKPKTTPEPNPEPKPAPELSCSKDKNNIVTTIAQSAIEEDLPETPAPKTTATKTWMGLLPRVDLAKAFRLKKAVPEVPIELEDRTMPVDEIMMPAQGLSEEFMVSARKLALSSVGQDSEEGDISLQEVTFKAPPPVKDL